MADDAEASRCGGAAFKLRELTAKVDALPDNVDPQVRQVLADGVDRLRDLVETDCQAPEAPATTQETEPPVTTETVPPAAGDDAKPKDGTGETLSPDDGEETQPSETLPDSTAGGQPAPAPTGKDKPPKAKEPESGQ